jgi:hypothetical protein
MANVTFAGLYGELDVFDPEAEGIEIWRDTLRRDQRQRGLRLPPSAAAGYRLDLYRTPQGTWIVHRYRLLQPPSERAFLPIVNADFYAGRPYIETTHEFAAESYAIMGLPISEALARDIQAARQPEPQAHSLAGPATHALPGEKAKKPTPTKPPRGMKQPSDRAFAAYRLVKVVGKTQAEVGERLRVKQCTVSRWVTATGKWIEAGNVLPPEMRAEPARRKPMAMDPSKLDQGPRLDRRGNPGRGKKTGAALHKVASYVRPRITFFP